MDCGTHEEENQWQCFKEKFFHGRSLDNAVHGQCTASVDIASYVSDCRRCDVYVKYKLCGDQDRVSYCYQYRELHSRVRDDVGVVLIVSMRGSVLDREKTFASGR